MMTHPEHIHVVTSIEAEASGPSYSVVRLAQAQASLGISSGIYSLSDYPKESRECGVCHRTFSRSFIGVPGISRLEFSNDMRRSVRGAAQQGSLLHVHGLWRMPNVYPNLAALLNDTPLVLSPRGMLGKAAFAYSAKQKQIFWHFAQKNAMRAVTCFHATSEAEMADIRAFGLTAPVAVIPNGIDVPGAALAQPREKEVLYLGRIHPKKGIDKLLRAWALVCGSNPEWRLRIVGPSEQGHLEELENLSRSLFLMESVIFDGPVYGDEKSKAYSRASLFVLPTSNENFGMVVAEALSQSTPVVSTVGAPWQGLVREGCGWWVEHGSEPMADALSDAMRRSATELNAMGARGRDWMLRDFGWPEIAAQTEQLYTWCRGQAERPGFVYT